jgi:uncharacterized RDD family membrane protein YckC
MKKQVIYPKFIPRIFAMLIDLVILSIILTPLMNIISPNVLIFHFQDFFHANGVNTSDMEAIVLSMRTPEFAQHLTAANFISYTGSLFIINTALMGMYFVFFWYKFLATPGKIILRMQIVNLDNHLRPSKTQLLKRFLGYITALIGIWSILFSKNGRALHDKIAGTVVIKI